MNLEELGWKKYLEKNPAIDAGFDVGRVSVENKNGYGVLTAEGEITGILRGKTLSGFDGKEFPKVGDWVRLRKLQDEQKAVILEILPRTTKISRKSADEDEEQVIVANVDVIFIVQSLPDDFSLRRLERYLVISKQSGAKPVVILNKIDLNDDYADMVTEAKSIALDAPVIAVSAKTGQGIEELKKHITAGVTFAFLGSSGVGKSSIVNAIIGEEKQVTNKIRDDGKGKHTTTRREIIFTKDGGILIDTPGMRELGLWSDESDIEKTFSDIEEIALECRYSNCDHDKSEGCAIKKALEEGRLNSGRYYSYLKLKKEREYAASKIDYKKQRERKSTEKKLSKKINKRLKEKY